MRKLAQRVQDSTDQIQSTIDRLLQAMEAAADQMTTSSTDATRCVNEALEDIKGMVGRIDHNNAEIANVSAEQTTGTDAVLADVQAIRETTETMVRELAASAEMSRRLKQLIDSLEQVSRQVSVQ